MAVRCHEHMLDFGDAHADAAAGSGVAVYALFTGVELWDRLGCADGQVLKGRLSPTLDIVMTAVDHHDGSASYEPDNVRHLAALTAQEIGHIWGETDHVCKVVSAQTYSIMCDNERWDEKDFWLTSGEPHHSAERVRNGTAELS